MAAAVEKKKSTVIVSGGFTGFSVAPDLLVAPQEDPEEEEKKEDVYVSSAIPWYTQVQTTNWKQHDKEAAEVARQLQLASKAPRRH